MKDFLFGVWSLFKLLPLWAKFSLIGFILFLVTGTRVPTSYGGYLWRQAMFAGQLTGCLYDSNLRVAQAAAMYDPEKAMKALSKEYGQFTGCQRDVDSNIGTTTFLRDQYLRFKPSPTAGGSVTSPESP